MTVYSETSMLYAYVDPEGTVATSLYEGQGAATSALYKKFEQGTGIQFADFKDGSYTQRFKAYRKAVRAAAKAEANRAGYKLMTYKLVRNE